MIPVFIHDKQAHSAWLSLRGSVQRVLGAVLVTAGGENASSVLQWALRPGLQTHWLIVYAQW